MRGDTLGNVLGLGAGGGDEVETARAFTVEAKVFGEGLGDAEFEAFGDEVAEGPGVIGEVATCETLVCTVEEGEVALGSHDCGDFFPLLLGGVYARGIVGAGVEEDDAAFWGITESGEHAIEVKAFGGGEEVGVGLDGQMDVAEDLVVVGPGGVGEVDRLG